MKILKFFAPAALSFLILCFSCDNGNDNNSKDDDIPGDSTPMGRPPNNDAATFPSLADTMSGSVDTFPHLADSANEVPH